MKSHYIVILIIQTAISKVSDVEKKKFCANLVCNSVSYETVCGFRSEGEGYRLKLFENECALLKYGCRVEEELGKMCEVFALFYTFFEISRKVVF